MKKLIVLILVFIASQNIFAQGGWQWINPSPQGNTMRDVKFISSNVAFAVGDAGTILKTTDKGVTWSRVLGNFSSNYIKICFPNDITGYIVSAAGEKLKTTNAGENWFILSTGPYGTINDMDFSNANTGFIVGDRRIVFKTTNGGINWVDIGSVNSSINYIKSVKILSQDSVLFGCDEGTYCMWMYTRGLWFFQSQAGYFVATSIDVKDNQIFACSYGAILFSTDFGISWVRKSAPNGTSKVKILGRDTIVIIASSAVYYSNNAGDYWNYCILPYYGLPYNLLGVDFFTKSEGVIVGSNGFFANSNNLINWTTNYNFFSTQNFSFARKISSQSVMVFGSYSSPIIKTTNSGNNWQILSLGSSGDLTDGVFLDSLTGFFSNIKYTIIGPPPSISRKDGRIFKTTNAGLSFTNIYEAFDFPFYGVTFLNFNIGYICGSKERILKTTNSGIEWFLIHSGDSAKNFYRTYFVNELIGYAGGDVGKLIKTSDGGESWSDISSIDLPNIYNIEFFDDNTGYLSGNSSVLFFTTNGGVNWKTIFPNVNYPINCFQFFNASTGYVLGNSSVSYTSNGGNSWVSQHFFTNSILNGILFTDMNTGFIVGTNGNIFKTTNSGGVFVSQISSQIPNKLSLHQNYPNPFNPTTKINYDIKTSGFVSLKVFDLLGKEVATLVNEKQNAGSYAVDFNSVEFNLPSGIYFYTLNAGEFKETRKMVLVK